MASSEERKTIQVEAFSRPIKVAYLVPFDESRNTHWILDAVFQEAYGRWGGAHTLVVPSSPDRLLDDRYLGWLKYYDPDFIYTYVNLNDELVAQLDSSCFPISFLKHESVTDEPERWRDYFPDFHHHFESVGSISTLLTPYAEAAMWRRTQGELKKVLLTQYNDPCEERFVADNFGIGHAGHMYTNPVPGLFETLCFARKESGDSVTAGSEESANVLYVLSRISEGHAVTFSTLSRVHAESLPRVESAAWSQSFSIFVGDSVLDRINFWNARHFSSGAIDVPSSLIISRDKLVDPNFVAHLGAYLNKLNFLGQTGGQSQVTIRSLSLGISELAHVADLLRNSRATYNYVNLKQEAFNQLAVPESRDLERAWARTRDGYSLKVEGSGTTILAEQPGHFQFNPPRFSFLNKGSWAVDLNMERPFRHSRYSNVTEWWLLPRNRNVTRVFTNRPSKVTRDHRLCLVLQEDESYAFRDIGKPNKRYFKLAIPDDSFVFRSLVVDPIHEDADDLRSKKKWERYDDLQISDKGQNLRGVISMFRNFSEAYEILTGRTWREIIRWCSDREMKGIAEDSEETRPVNIEKFLSFMPSDLEFKKELPRRVGTIAPGKIQAYMEACIKDALEYFVERSVFFQVHRWRCDFCGHINVKSIDEIRKKNKCSICKLTYFSPIDLQWQYKINSFVSESLSVRNGMSVLWALGWLRDQAIRDSLYFIPEVNLLFKDGKREEIDILAVVGGTFVAAEVKKTATTFLRKDGDIEKFVRKIKRLRPDIAYLMFEEYADKADSLESTKAELQASVARIRSELRLFCADVKLVVGSDQAKFREHFSSFEAAGPRAQRIMYGD